MIRAVSMDSAPDGSGRSRMGDTVDLEIADVVVSVGEGREQHGDASHHDRLGLGGSPGSPPRAKHHASHGEQRVFPSRK